MTLDEILGQFADLVANRVAERLNGRATMQPSVPPLPNPPALERHLTPGQVEALLQVPAGYAYDHQRQLGGVKVGKYLRFPESAIRRRLERSR